MKINTKKNKQTITKHAGQGKLFSLSAIARLWGKSGYFVKSPHTVVTEEMIRRLIEKLKDVIDDLEKCLQ